MNAKKKPTRKLILVDAFLPEVASVHANPQGRAEGSSIAVGLKRAVQSILRQPGIKRKRISTMKLTVSVLPVEEKQDV